jgi:ADP-ribose pyrophosphatase YjhB (NUDIX family)
MELSCPKRNKPYLAFDPNETKKTGDGYGWLVSKEEVRTLYDGRYCAVSGFFYAVVDGKYSVLAEKRGKGTPDFQGMWCCPCGFLEGDENCKEGIKRETYEECGIEVDYGKIKFVEAETDPLICNNGNVTLRHTGFLKKQSKIERPDLEAETRGGEHEEVAEVAWIPLSHVDRYEWAFGHGKIIKKYAKGWFLRKILEVLYR